MLPNLSQNLAGVFLDLDLLRPDDTCDDTVLVGDEGGAEHAHRHLAIHFLLAINTQFCDELLLRIANQGER